MSSHRQVFRVYVPSRSQRVLAGTALPNGSIARPFARVPWPAYGSCNLGKILRDPSGLRPLTDLPHHAVHHLRLGFLEQNAKMRAAVRRDPPRQERAQKLMVSQRGLET